jgi:hypothetical protein
MQPKVSSFTKWNSVGAAMMAIGMVLLCVGVLNARQYPRDHPDRRIPRRRSDDRGEASAL